MPGVSPALSPSLILTATLPVAMLLATGFFLRKRNVVDEGLRAGLMSLVLNVFFPALVFAKVSLNPALKNDAVALAAPATGFLSLLAGYAISACFVKAAGADTPERRRAFVYTAGNYNYGYLAIPVCEAFYGPESVAVLLLFNAGLELAFWTVGSVILTGDLKGDLWKRVLNPVTVAMIAAIVTNRTGLSDRLPDWLFRGTGMMGGCAVPCGLLLVGMGIPALLQGFRATHDFRLATVAVILRNGLIPALFVAAGLFIGLPDDVARLLLLQAAMPGAIFPIVMCQHYRVAPQVALRIAVATTLFGIGTLPFWLWLGAKLRMQFP